MEDLHVKNKCFIMERQIGGNVNIPEVKSYLSPTTATP